MKHEKRVHRDIKPSNLLINSLGFVKHSTSLNKASVVFRRTAVTVRIDAVTVIAGGAAVVNDDVHASHSACSLQLAVHASMATTCSRQPHSMHYITCSAATTVIPTATAAATAGEQPAAHLGAAGAVVAVTVSAHC
eukprot:11408-Heterococcus_DN1.PRE.3